MRKMRAYVTGLVVILGLIGSQARADSIATLKIKDGGHLVLLDEGCDSDDSLKSGYLYDKTGRTIAACWTYDTNNKTVVVKYDDGDVYTYDVTDFDMLK
jgi:hypothetical protein